MHGQADANAVVAKCDFANRNIAILIAVNVNRVVIAARGIDHVAGRREHQAHMRIGLLDRLQELRIGLVRPRHIVEEDVLRRVRDVGGASVRVVQRVLPGADHRQRIAIRAELRPHRFTGDKVWVLRQPRIEVLLHRAAQHCWGDIVPGRQRNAAGARWRAVLRLRSKRHGQHGAQQKTCSPWILTSYHCVP